MSVQSHVADSLKFSMSETAYDRIGRGYATTRRADPRIAARIELALGDAASVVNVGAGAGSYEPVDRDVIAVEPSREMIAQRRPGAARAICGSAEQPPLPDAVADAAMTILSIHHWDDPARGVTEMRRVARRRIVVLTYDPDYVLHWWLGEYAPQIAADDAERFPPLDGLLGWLGGGSVETIEVPADCTDLFLGALWARPELVLADEIRASTSGFARMDGAQERTAIAKLRDDLESGAWDERHGHLREADQLDVGLRLVVCELDQRG
jgi:SAM-dependent methyltransferase